jgi:hypothetical protein
MRVERGRVFMRRTGSKERSRTTSRDFLHFMRPGCRRTRDFVDCAATVASKATGAPHENAAVFADYLHDVR